MPAKRNTAEHPPLPGGRRGASESSKTRWEEILRSAQRVIHLKGFPATSIQDIADEVGILKGSLYYYIKTKDDLLNAIIGEFFAGWQAAFEEIRLSGGDILTKIGALIRSDVVVVGSNPLQASIFFRELNWVDPDLRKQIVAAREAHDRYLRELIEKGQFEGLIRWDLNPKTMSLALFSLISVQDWFRPEKGWSIDFVASQYVDFALSGLRAPTDQQQRRSGPRRKSV
jgi:TetR/AcrR family transcriptional regulator, cholesterol catabolism regulator